VKDVLNERERDEVENCRRFIQEPCSGPAESRIAWLLSVIDRIAPKPAPKETVEDVLAEMRSARGKNFGYGETVRLHLEVHDWANRIEAALKSGAK
jgi:hypothetical protein